MLGDLLMGEEVALFMGGEKYGGKDCLSGSEQFNMKRKFFYKRNSFLSVTIREFLPIICTRF